MRKRLFILVAAIVSISLWGCSKSDDLKQQEPAADNEESFEAKEEQTEEPDEETVMKKAYVRAIRDFVDSHVLPDGTDVTDDILDYDPFSKNSFAVYDIDGDGVEELDIRFVTTYTTAAFERIYGYDKDSDTLYEKLDGYPYMQYYTYGYMKQLDSHNQGVSGDFWPYYLRSYDRNSDSFGYVAYVEAWDGNSYPEDMDGNKFPVQYDKDGDGMIFYLRHCEEPYDQINDTPFDYTELREWLYNNMSYTDPDTDLKYMAERIYLPFRSFDEDDIDAYENSGRIQTDVSSDDFTRFELKDMVFWMPNDFLDKATVKEGEDSYTFYHTKSMEAMKKEYPDEDFTGGFLFSICALKDSDEVYDSESYCYYGSSPSTDGKTENYHYLAFRPTDMPGAGGNESISEYLEMQYQCNHIYEEIKDGVKLKELPFLDGQEEDASDDDGNAGSSDKTKVKSAYLKAIKTFSDSHILPDGSDVTEDISDLTAFAENRFAVCDVDGDGEEELVILFTSTYHAAYCGYIYGYDERTHDLYEELSCYPEIEFYSYGCLKEMDSSNQGVSGDFWPYTLYRYDPAKKQYKARGHVEAWDGNQYPEDMNGKKFPRKYDKDGDGMIYYLQSCEPPYSYLTDEPVDIEQLNRWLRENMSYTGTDPVYSDVAYKISVPLRHFNEESIDTYEESENIVTLPDPDEYTRFQIKDMTFWLPDSFMDKVVVKGGDDHYTFYHKKSLDAYRKLYPGEEYPGGYLFTVRALDDDAEVYEDENFYYYGSSPSSDGKTKYYNYAAFLPTDVQYYEDSRECSAEYTQIQYQFEDVHEIIKDCIRFPGLPNFVYYAGTSAE